MFFLGFEKQASIDLFYRNRNSYTDKVHSLLGPGYEKEHVQSYIKNLRPWDANKSHEETATDVKRLYDKKEKYNKVQAGLLKTKEGSPEEGAYLKKNKGNLDKHIADWANDNADTMEKYKSPYASAGRAASKFLSGQFGKQAFLWSDPELYKETIHSIKKIIKPKQALISMRSALKDPKLNREQVLKDSIKKYVSSNRAISENPSLGGEFSHHKGGLWSSIGPKGREAYKNKKHPESLSQFVERNQK